MSLLSSSTVVSRTILVIDDEPVVRLVVSRLLEQWDFSILQADNGRMGLQLAQTHKDGLSMVITDLVMPYMDGYEFASAFRPLHPEVPILFVTGICPNAMVGSLTGNEDNLLFKPFDPDKLLDTVARLLESSLNHGRVSV